MLLLRARLNEKEMRPGLTAPPNSRTQPLKFMCQPPQTRRKWRGRGGSLRRHMRCRGNAGMRPRPPRSPALPGRVEGEDEVRGAGAKGGATEVAGGLNPPLRHAPPRRVQAARRRLCEQEHLRPLALLLRRRGVQGAAARREGEGEADS